VLSHAHLDHSGFVPVLFKYGYEGPVYCTEPTLTLTTLLLTDALKVAEAEGKKLYYDMSHVKEFIKHCITLPYNFVTDIAPDVKLTLTNAGHILGSATIHLHIGQGLFNLVYTGDYKFGKSRLFQPANYIYPRVEALITESTYGGKDDIMPAREEAEERLINSINETVNQGGKVLIPVPAVGRAQEILLVLNDYISQKKLKEVPIYIEGMLTEATSIHLLYPEFLNKEIRDKIIFQGENPFITERYTIISHPKEREEVFAGGPSIIIATSGMLEGGPSVAYFSELSEDPRNKVIFVSYQVSGTLGRRVLDGSKQINIMDSNGKIRVINVNLKVEKIDGFSGHSDYNQLLNYISKFKNKVQKIIVVHGEDTKAKNLNESINRIVFRKNISEVPKVGETIKLY
jgi:Predicted metal-dependent RNase, consists of a metallo-beta-lactamase domain and an RNA-binding KH domain